MQTWGERGLDCFGLVTAGGPCEQPALISVIISLPSPPRSLGKEGRWPPVDATPAGGLLSVRPLRQVLGERGGRLSPSSAAPASSGFRGDRAVQDSCRILRQGPG